MLQPGEVGVARRRRAILPAYIVLQAFTAPVRDVEGRIRQHMVGPQIRVGVFVKAALVVPGDVVTWHFMNGQIHFA